MSIDRVCIVGAGVIGSLCAVHLAREAEVSILVRREEHADALNEHGLEVSGKSNFTSSVFATTDPGALPEFGFRNRSLRRPLRWIRPSLRSRAGFRTQSS